MKKVKLNKKEATRLTHLYKSMKGKNAPKAVAEI